MADFTKSFNRTSKTEAGWCNVEGDSGGETWNGIARNYHPTWEGWALVDFIKSNLKFPEKPEKEDIDKLNAALFASEKLAMAEKKFFKTKFWDKIRGDEIKAQVVADSLYDSSVNMGDHQAVTLAQRALKIKETGILDTITLNALNNKR